MTAATEIASDVIAGGAALAGLILVYIGGLASGYAAFEPQQQHAVRHLYRRHAWVAFAGFLVAAASVGSALIAKWFHLETLAAVSIILLLVALLVAVYTALETILDIK